MFLIPLPQQGELEGKMTALALRLEQQLEERDRKIEELAGTLREREEAGQKAAAEVRELIAEREAAIRMEVTDAVVQKTEASLEEKLREVETDLEEARKKSSEERERQDDATAKLREELQRSQEQVRELVRQNRELKVEMENLPQQLLAVAGSELRKKEEEGMLQQRREEEREQEKERDKISFERFESELAAVRKEFEERQLRTVERLKDSFEAEKRELRGLFKENERRLKEENDTLRKRLEHRELQASSDSKDYARGQQRLTELIQRIERRLDDEMKAEIGRLANGVAEMRVAADNDRNEHHKRLAVLTENVDGLAENVTAARRALEATDGRFASFEVRMAEVELHCRPPPPPEVVVYAREEEAELDLGGGRKVALTLEEQILAAALKRVPDAASAKERKLLDPALDDTASLLFTGLQKRFNHIHQNEKIEELDDEDDEEEPEF